MKRKPLLIILFICILLSIGCDKPDEISKTNLEEMVMIKDEIWNNTGFVMDVQVDEDEIIGGITSTVKGYEIPTENNQANFEIKGSKYSIYGKDIILSIDNKWVLFLREEDRGKYDVPINNMVSIDYSNLDKDIFGDLSDEKINNLFIDIVNEIYEDEEYEGNLDTIIIKIFRKYGVDISSNLDVVKSKLVISKPNAK